MILHRYVFAAVAAALLFCGSVSAQKKITDYIKYIPGSANAVGFVNIEKIHASRIGQAEGAKTEAEKRYAAGLTIVPPDAQWMISAEEINLADGEAKWDFVLMKFNRSVSIDKLAEMYGGKLDEIAGHEAVVLPNNSYAVLLEPQLIAGMSPANRQKVSRWLWNYGKEPISEYLIKALGLADEVGTEVIIALDTQYAIHPERARLALREADIKELPNSMVQPAAATLASLQGVTLGVRVTDGLYGGLKWDFGKDLPPEGATNKELGKKIMLALLGQAGMYIDDFETWNVARDKKSVKFTGRLSPAGMRQVSSLFNTDTPADRTVRGQGGGEQDEQTRMALATQEYFRAVSTYVDDFKEKKKHRKTIGQMSVWMKQYGKKIDNLPILNVDPMAIDYGSTVARSLRGAAGGITRTVGAGRIQQVNANAAGTGGEYSYGRAYGRGWNSGGYAGTGTWWRPNTLAEQQSIGTQIKTATNIQSGQIALGTLQEIDNMTAEVRVALTQKYQVEF